MSSCSPKGFSVSIKGSHGGLDVPSDQQSEKSSVSLSQALSDGVGNHVDHQTANEARSVAKILREVDYENYSESVNGVKNGCGKRKPTF